MKLSRRKLGQIVLGMAVAGTSGWRSAACAHAAAAPIDGALYPTLARVASLYPEATAWQRLVSTLSTSALAQLTVSGLARAERNAARAYAKRRRSVTREFVSELLASDFRHGRTVRAGAFLIAESEAALLLLRLAADPRGEAPGMSR
jgi:hypothetical protein